MYFHSKARQALHQCLFMLCSVMLRIGPPVSPYKSNAGFFYISLCSGVLEWRMAALNDFINQDSEAELKI